MMEQRTVLIVAHSVRRPTALYCSIYTVYTSKYGSIYGERELRGAICEDDGEARLPDSRS